MERVELRGDRISSRSDLLDALGEALGFFDRYGRNLDALWDCLEDPDLRLVKGPAEIHWTDWRRYHQNDPEGFEKVVAQFEETSAAAIATSRCSCRRGTGSMMAISRGR